MTIESEIGKLEHEIKDAKEGLKKKQNPNVIAWDKGSIWGMEEWLKSMKSWQADHQKRWQADHQKLEDENKELRTELNRQESLKGDMKIRFKEKLAEANKEIERLQKEKKALIKPFLIDDGILRCDEHGQKVDKGDDSQPRLKPNSLTAEDVEKIIMKHKNCQHFHAEIVEGEEITCLDAVVLELKALAKKEGKEA